MCNMSKWLEIMFYVNALLICAMLSKGDKNCNGNPKNLSLRLSYNSVSRNFLFENKANNEWGPM